MGPGEPETPRGGCATFRALLVLPTPCSSQGSSGLWRREVVTPIQGSDRPLGTDAAGGSRCVPKATRLRVLEERWEAAAASARAPAAAQIPTAPREPRSPFPPGRGEAPAGPADIPALPACRAGRTCEATPGSSLSAPRPFAPGSPGIPAAAPGSPRSPWGHRDTQPLIPSARKQPGSLAEAVPALPPSPLGAGYLHSLCKRDFIIGPSQPISILVIGVVLISVWLGVAGGPAMPRR